MTVATGNITGLVADFVIGAVPPPLARQRAGVATCDTIGVALAGFRNRPRKSCGRRQQPTSLVHVDSSERMRGPMPARRRWQTVSRLMRSTSMTCVSSLWRTPVVRSCQRHWPRRKWRGHPGRALLDAYVVGFEVECRLGMVMNPRHFTRADGTARRPSAHLVRPLPRRGY